MTDSTPNWKKADAFVLFPPSLVKLAAPEVAQLATAVGLIAIRWGRYEQHLDALQHILINLHHEQTGESKRKATPNLEAKLGNIEKQADLCKLPLKVPAMLSAVIKGTLQYADERHLLMHATLRHCDAGPPVAGHYTHARYRGNDSTVRTQTFTLDEIEVLGKNIDKLHRELFRVIVLCVAMTKAQQRSNASPGSKGWELAPEVDGKPGTFRV